MIKTKKKNQVEYVDSRVRVTYQSALSEVK
jgi:hypothetical protein